MQCASGCQGMRDDLIGCSVAGVIPSRMRELAGISSMRGSAGTSSVLWRKIAGIHDGQSKVESRDGDAGPRRGPPEQLNLQPGEFVEVRSEQEILQTLDGQGKHRGLAWMPNMARCCGKTYAVYKRVKRIMLESSGEIRVVRNTVLLEGGDMCENLYGCDRSCHHFSRSMAQESVRRADESKRPSSSVRYGSEVK